MTQTIYCGNKSKQSKLPPPYTLSPHLMTHYNAYTCRLKEFYMKLPAPYCSVCGITSAACYKLQVVSFSSFYLMHILVCTG